MKKLKKLKIKLKKISKKNPFILPIAIIVMLIVAIIFISLAPTIIQYITEGDIEDESDNILNYYDYSTFTIGEGLIWEEILYVHQDGNDDFGYDWEHAFTSINAAVARAQRTPFWTTLILVGSGTWDCFVPYYLNIDRNIIIIGTGVESTIFINSHNLATSVFRIESWFYGANFQVHFAEHDGIVVGENLRGFWHEPKAHLNNVHFNTNASAVAGDTGLSLETGEDGLYENLYFNGAMEPVIGINVSNTRLNTFNNLRFFLCDTSAIWFGHGGADFNHFETGYIFWSSIGIDLDFGDMNYFEDYFFNTCPIAIDDEQGNSLYINVHSDQETSHCVPIDMIGTTINTGVAANAWSVAWIEILGAAFNDMPYYITGFTFESNVAERYGIQLRDSIDLSIVTEGVYEGTGAVYIPIENSEFFSHGTSISGRCKSESGGDSIIIWVNYITLQ